MRYLFGLEIKTETLIVWPVFSEITCDCWLGSWRNRLMQSSRECVFFSGAWKRRRRSRMFSFRFSFRVASWDRFRSERLKKKLPIYGYAGMLVLGSNLRSVMFCHPLYAESLSSLSFCCLAPLLLLLQNSSFSLELWREMFGRSNAPSIPDQGSTTMFECTIWSVWLMELPSGDLQVPPCLIKSYRQLQGSKRHRIRQIVCHSGSFSQTMIAHNLIVTLALTSPSTIFISTRLTFVMVWESW